MNTTRARLTTTFAALAALVLTFTGAITLDSDRAGAATADRASIVTIADGQVRGVAVDGGYAFRGLPYAAPPIGHLRWRPPQPPARWAGVRDASQFAPSPLQPGPTLSTPSGNYGLMDQQAALRWSRGTPAACSTAPSCRAERSR